MASTVGVRELRQNLSKYLDRVKAGEDFVVTERGNVVARLVPEHVEDGYLELARKFGATIPTARLEDVIASLPPRSAPAGTVDAELAADRAERLP